MPTDTLTEDQTILGAPTESTTGDPNVTSAAPNAKPNDGKPSDGSGQDPAKPQTPDEKQGQEPSPKPQPPAVPETYTFTVPDGLALDEEVVKEITPIFKEFKLTNEQAQRLVDVQSKLALKAAEDARAEYRQMKETWEQESTKQLGANAKQELAYGSKAIDRFGDDALRTFFNESGVGSHPAIVKFVVGVGKALSEDSFAEGKPAGGTVDKTPGEVLYPNLPKN